MLYLVNIKKHTDPFNLRCASIQRGNYETENYSESNDSPMLHPAYCKGYANSVVGALCS